MLPCWHTGLHIFGIKDPTSFEYPLWELNVRGAIKIEGCDEGGNNEPKWKKNLWAILWDKLSDCGDSYAAAGGHAPIRCRNATILPK